VFHVKHHGVRAGAEGGPKAWGGAGAVVGLRCGCGGAGAVECRPAVRPRVMRGPAVPTAGLVVSPNSVTSVARLVPCGSKVPANRKLLLCAPLERRGTSLPLRALHPEVRSW
jgi:hypothetical protein